MATVTGLTAPRMLEIEANSIVNGLIDLNGDLILTTHGGETINAGQVEAARLMGVTDSASVDLGLTGNGSLATPWNLTASVKVIDAIQVTSGLLSIDRIPDLTIMGVLEATYQGEGPAKVKVAGVLSSVALPWLTLYKPNGPRSVRLIKAGTTWQIVGQVQAGGGQIVLNPASCTTYREYDVSNVFSSNIRAVRLPTGIVALSGLLKTIGALGLNVVLGYLPVDCRPDFDTILAVEVGDQSKSITIKANGEIHTRAGWPSTQYVSLDGLAYPAAGVATWIPITNWGSNFNGDAGGSWPGIYGTPSYWKDPLGTVWFQGLVKTSVLTSADATPMFTLPVGYRADYYQHVRTVGNDGFAHFGMDPNTGEVEFKINNPGEVGSWFSLAGVTITTAEARTGQPWIIPRALGSSWQNYSFPTFARSWYCRREDGLCQLAGLVNVGTVGQRILALPKEMWPSYGRIILSSVANAARGRIDIGGDSEADAVPMGPGIVSLSQGANQWYSMDNKMWVP